jgi:hypothetical protein
MQGGSPEPPGASAPGGLLVQKLIVAHDAAQIF